MVTRYERWPGELDDILGPADGPDLLLEEVAKERERCLAILDRFNIPGHSVVGPVLANIADAIRAPDKEA